MALIGNTYGKGRVRVMRVHRDGDAPRGARAFGLGDGAGRFRQELHARRQFAGPVHRHGEEPRQHRRAREPGRRQGSLLLGCRRSPACQIPPGVDCGRDGARDEVDAPACRRQTAPAQLRARRQRQAVRPRHRLARQHVVRIRRVRLHLPEVDAIRLGEILQGRLHHAQRDAPTASAPPAWTRPGAGRGTLRASRRPMPSCSTRMLEVFATTYSKSVQDSLYRMATAALEAVPEVSEIRLACPNKHYIPIDLSPFGLANKQPGVPADRRAARPDRMPGRPRLSHDPRRDHPR